MNAMRSLYLSIAAGFAASLFSAFAPAQAGDPPPQTKLINCDELNSGICADRVSHKTYEGKYSGHDEPALLFYSDVPGSGNNVVYRVVLPKDPPVAPAQDGSGGTFSFQLHLTFWLGMVMCDPSSSPLYTSVCKPDSDDNIFDSSDPNAPDFIGHHPGTAQLELQFYPPFGGVQGFYGSPVLPTWSVAMTIDSYQLKGDPVTGVANNADCLEKVGIEPVNFAYLTLDGKSQSPADPLNFDNAGIFGYQPGKTFVMNSGDELLVRLYDTPAGLRAVVQDLTTGQTGWMTASRANGFAQVKFIPDPDPAHPSVTCSSQPYAFHPAFATSNEHTRNVWSAHTSNVSYTDETGHFQFCNGVDHEFGSCVAAGADDADGPDADDTFCMSADFAPTLGFKPLGACYGANSDFDGTPYQLKWPGTGNPQDDAQLKPSPVRFTSPLFEPSGVFAAGPRQYSRIAFETDLPNIQYASNPSCFTQGIGCMNPPAAAQFYPIFSTTMIDGECWWQEGGPGIPGTTDNFGGSSTTEYGEPYATFFPALPGDPYTTNGVTATVYADLHRILHNPCTFPPQWAPPTPADGSRFTLTISRPFSVVLRADERDVADQVHIAATGIPAHAVLNSFDGNPAHANFSWKPVAGQAGDYLVTFTAADSGAPTSAAPSRTYKFHVQ